MLKKKTLLFNIKTIGTLDVNKYKLNIGVVTRPIYDWIYLDIST
jgi:hypothetical protein